MHWTHYRLAEAWASCIGKYKGLDLNSSLSKRYYKAERSATTIFDWSVR